jgi:2-phosphosulfolactate phosphatase
VVSFTDQGGFAYRFDWGLDGLYAIGPSSEAIVIVDVLSFTTAVDVAVARGATVLPHGSRPTAEAYAGERSAIVAIDRGEQDEEGWSLSPASMTTIPPGTRVVLPSPNGSALASAAAEIDAAIVLAACVRNATAVAQAARSMADTIAVVAAGEHWFGWDGSMRPCVEDLLGAGAVLTALDPSASVSIPRCSPEAAAARAAFVGARPRLAEALRACASGVELIEQGFADDVEIAAALDASTTVPVLKDGAFIAL